METHKYVQNRQRATQTDRAKRRSLIVLYSIIIMFCEICVELTARSARRLVARECLSVICPTVIYMCTYFRHLARRSSDSRTHREQKMALMVLFKGVVDNRESRHIYLARDIPSFSIMLHATRNALCLDWCVVVFYIYSALYRAR